MSSMRETLRAFFREEAGLETVEYAVMTAGIVAALVTAITLLAGSIEGRLANVQGTIDGV